MKKFILVLSLCFSSVAFSAGITTENLKDSFGNLTEQQKAEIAKSIADKAAENKITVNGVVAPTTIDEAQKWVDLGSKLGQSLGAAARELGVLVSDFLKTPVGKLTAVLIIWKIIGADIIHLFGASMMFFFILPLNIFMFRRYVFAKTFKDFTTTKFIKGATHQIVKTKMFYKSEGDGQTFCFYLINILIVGGGLLCLFTI